MTTNHATPTQKFADAVRATASPSAAQPAAGSDDGASLRQKERTLLQREADLLAREQQLAQREALLVFREQSVLDRSAQMEDALEDFMGSFHKFYGFLTGDRAATPDSPVATPEAAQALVPGPTPIYYTYRVAIADGAAANKITLRQATGMPKRMLHTMGILMDMAQGGYALSAQRISDGYDIPVSTFMTNLRQLEQQGYVAIVSNETTREREVVVYNSLNTQLLTPPPTFRAQA